MKVLWRHTAVTIQRSESWSASCCYSDWMVQIYKYHNAPVPYPTMHNSEQKCAHFCSEWCTVGYGTGALWDLCDWSIACPTILSWYHKISVTVWIRCSFMFLIRILRVIKNFWTELNSIKSVTRIPNAGTWMVRGLITWHGCPISSSQTRGAPWIFMRKLFHPQAIKHNKSDVKCQNTLGCLNK